MIKRITTVLLIISICFLAFFIVSTYSKYSTELPKSTNITFKRWNILVNTSDIEGNSNFSQNLTPFIDSNEHIDSNVIAPTSSGYFDIVIDSSHTDLPFDYTLSFTYLNSNDIIEIQDFKITEYSTDNGVTRTDMPIEDITATVAANINSIAYRFYVEWDDSISNITNNAGDTELALLSAKAYVNVNINFKQCVPNN